MKICVVDDEIVWQNKIATIVRQYLNQNGIKNTEVIICDSLEEINDYCNIDLFFLDIEFTGNKDGLELAETINACGNKCTICFVTSHLEMARLGYKVNAFRFIDKCQLDEVNEALDAFFLTEIQNRYLGFDFISGRNQKVLLENIEYFETGEHRAIMHTNDGRTYEISESMESIEGRLINYGFYRIQRSYIINMSYIDFYNSRMIMMKSGKEMAIGRKKYKDFKQSYFSWRMCSLKP